MEQFDQSAVGRAQDMRAKVKASTMVQESKARQRNAWGGGSSVSEHYLAGNLDTIERKCPCGVDVSTMGAWHLALLIDDPLPCWVCGGGVWRCANACPPLGGASVVAHL